MEKLAGRLVKHARPGTLSQAQAGTAIRALPDQLEMKNFRKSSTSEEPGYRLIRYWEDQMEIPAELSAQGETN